MPPPPQIPAYHDAGGWLVANDPRQDTGTCVVSRLEDGRLRIDRADPEILVSEELLDAVGKPCEPDAHLQGKPSYCIGSCVSEYVSYGDGILTIRAENGTVSYGVGEYLPAPHAYVARKSPELAADA